MAYSTPTQLLGWWASDRYPTPDPAFASSVGWLVFGAVLMLLLWAWTRAESIRRSLLALEDPRTFAALRIGFGLMTIACFLNLYPYWRMLWSDEGILDLAYAQERLGRGALRGWSPEEGFFDLWSIACFLWNKPSLFYLYGSPNFVTGYMLTFFGVLALYTAGVCSRVTGVVAWLMMSGIYNRNALYWEGTDTVYRCFWFVLLFARTGHAWSFDNWLRCRRLGREGKLLEPGEDPLSAPSKQPIYRLVPAWPRYLFILQLAAIYVCTGVLKTGSVWARGDALYYALNMDHLYRFEGATQVVSSVFATNLFRLMTWVTHWWERLFGLVLVGLVLRFGLEHRARNWYSAQDVPWRKWLGRLALVAAYGVIYRTAFVSVPWCLALRNDQPQDPGPALLSLHIAFGIVIPLYVLAWFALRRWPLTLFRGGRSLGALTRRHAWARLPQLQIDAASLRAWTLGRRVWMSLGVVFHGFLFAFMNLGMFPLIMLMTYVAYLRGDELVQCLRKLTARARRRGDRRAVLLERALGPAAPPPIQPVRGRSIPDTVLLVLGLLGAGLVAAKVERVSWQGTATYVWLGLVLVVALVYRCFPPRPRDLAYTRESGPALAYGAVGRSLAVAAVVWHAGAVAVHLSPKYPLFSRWRSPISAIYGGWLTGTGTSQSWSMFAPNPPRSNSFMKTVVVLDDGERWDLRNNAFSERPNPWIINDRMRKMQRRMMGKSKWYLRHWAAYQCREWALEHGEIPKRIEIKKLMTKIPKPELVNVWQPARFKGRTDPYTGAISGQPYDPRELRVRERDVKSFDCDDDVFPLYMKERYGMPVTDEDRERAEREARDRIRKFANNRRNWERRRDFGGTWTSMWDEREE